MSVLLEHPARVSPHLFIPRCRIRPAEGGMPIPFALWEAQTEVLDDFLLHDRIVVLKARQLGLSWESLAYALWLASCNTGQTVLIINQGQREAAELLERIKFMHRELPDDLQAAPGRDRFDQIDFPEMDSRILSLPAGPHAGSGLTATLVIMDEWAKLAHAESIFTAVMPTLSAGGKWIGISTAEGYNNLFAQVWGDAVKGINEFHPIFLPWNAHPDRDEAWYDRTRRNFPNPRRFLSQYPETHQEAFQLPGDACFEEFDPFEHTTTVDPDIEAAWPDYRGVDFGYHFSPCLWAEVQADRVVYVYDELDQRESETTDLAREIDTRELEPLHADRNRPPEHSGVDPAGKAQTSVSTQSDHDTLRNFGHTVLAADVAPKERVALIKRLLRDHRLIINAARCPMLVLALEQALWDRHGKDGPPKETYEKDGLYDHYLDALGYLLITVLPTKGKPSGAQQRPAAGVGSGFDRTTFG